MAKIEPRKVDPETGVHASQILLKLPDGSILPNAAECDPAKGTVTLYVTCKTPEGGQRVLVDGKSQKIARAVIFTDFDIFHRQTGEHLHSVRWSKVKSRRPKLAHKVRPLAVG